MGRLIGLVRPLIHIMAAAILLGVIGYLCAIFLTILASGVLIHGISAAGTAAVSESIFLKTSVTVLLAVMVTAAIARGILHYGEQACNHFIAFKLLALIRHKVFKVLRTLAPAKLEGRDKGNLIAILTSDIELLEVFLCAYHFADRNRCADVYSDGCFYRTFPSVGRYSGLRRPTLLWGQCFR